MIWMAVTSDKNESVVGIADTSNQLDDFLGVSHGRSRTALSKHQNIRFEKGLVKIVKAESEDIEEMEHMKALIKRDTKMIPNRHGVDLECPICGNVVGDELGLYMNFCDECGQRLE